MICLAFLMCSVGIVLSAPTDDLPSLGVIGGQKAKQEDFKYMISLMIKGKHHCGGTLVYTNIVVTAAHCTHDVPISYLQVRVGSGRRESGGQVHDVKDVVIHPDFTIEKLQSDVSIVQLKTHAKLGKNVGLMRLARGAPLANTPAIVSGWGHIKDGGPLSDDLLFVNVPILDRAYCAYWLALFNKEMICAGKLEGGVDACQADSGGPLIAHNSLVGIVSWGIGCGRRNQPAAYTNVGFLRLWIEKAIKELNQKESTDTKFWQL